MQHTFFEPGTKFLGQHSALDKRSIPKGGLARFENFRYKRALPEIRGPIKLKTISGTASGSLRGAGTFTLNGTTREFVALRVSSTTRVYRSTTDGETFTEITAVAGKYPDTRFSTDEKICFAVVRQPFDPFISTDSGTDYMVFSNGTETMVWQPVTDVSCPVQKVWHPGEGHTKQWAVLPVFFSMLAANVTSTDTANVTSANNQATTAGGLTPYIRYESGAAVSGNYGNLLFGTPAFVAANGGDVVIVYDTANFADPWACLKIQLSTDNFSTVTKTLYDPSVDDQPDVVDLEKSFMQAAFKVDPVDVPNSNYNAIRFVWVAGHSPSANADIFLIAIGGGGSTPGGWDFAAGYYNPASFTDSVSVVADNKGGRHLSLMGLQDMRNDVAINVNVKTRYSYVFEYPIPSQAEINKGAAYLLFYGAPSGVDTLRIVDSVAVASYSGGWGGSATVGSVVQRTLDPVANQKVFSTLPVRGNRPMPDGLNEPCPPCTSMVTASGRLFCGGAQTDLYGGSAVSGSDVLFSDQDFPGRFRGLVETNDGSPREDSGGRLQFNGEKVTQLGSVATALQEIDTVLIFTDQSLHSVAGRDATSLSRPRRIGYHGTKSPWSVSSYRNAVYWLDQEKQVCSMVDNQISVIGKYKIDDVTTGIPDAYIGNVSGFVSRGLYLLALTLAGGTTNTLVLFYDTFLEFWGQDVTAYSTTFGKFFVWGDELRFWAQDGTLLEHDSSTGTQDHGSNAIVGVLVSPEVSPTLLEDYEFKTPWVCVESESGVNATVSITGGQSGSTSSGTALLTDSNTFLKTAPAQSVGIDNEDSAYTTVCLPMSSRKSVRAFGMELTMREGEKVKRT